MSHVVPIARKYVPISIDAFWERFGIRQMTEIGRFGKMVIMEGFFWDRRHKAVGVR
jgi:hypothetical protein